MSHESMYFRAHVVSGSHRGQCRHSTAPSLRNVLWHRVVNRIQMRQSLATDSDGADLLMHTLPINEFITHTHTHGQTWQAFFPITFYYLFQVMAETGKFLFHCIPLGIFNI